MQPLPPPSTADPPATTTQQEISTSIFRSYADQMAPTQRLGQAFHSVGFEAECKVVNRHWAIKRGFQPHDFFVNLTHEPQVSRNNIACRKILTETAMQRIQNDHSTGRYVKRVGKLEPAYMPPSADPDDYSKVRLSNPLPML
jgi:hypothetical protein